MGTALLFLHFNRTKSSLKLIFNFNQPDIPFPGMRGTQTAAKETLLLTVFIYNPHCIIRNSLAMLIMVATFSFLMNLCFSGCIFKKHP